MIFKLTNLMGTKRDPRRKRRSALTRRPVRIGIIKLSPRRTIIIDEHGYRINKGVIDTYLDNHILAVTSHNIRDFNDLRARTDAEASAAATIVEVLEEANERYSYSNDPVVVAKAADEIAEVVDREILEEILANSAALAGPQEVSQPEPITVIHDEVIVLDTVGGTDEVFAEPAKQEKPKRKTRAKRKTRKVKG